MADRPVVSALRRWDERRPYTLLAGLYVLCLALFLATLPLPRADGQLVGSDGIYYYAYLPSILLDGDLDFRNQYEALLPTETVAAMQPTPLGRLPNAYAVGPAILWSPFFLAGHLLALVLHAAGVSSLAGTSALHQAATLVGSLTYGFVGLLLIYRSCRRFFSQAAGAATVVLIWLGTNVIYYMVAEPSMSHAPALFANALFLALWLAARPTPSLRRWVTLGVAGGLVALVRLPDATCLALPILDWLAARDRKQTFARHAAGPLAYMAFALAAFAPQMAIWRLLYGSPFASGYLYTDQPTFHWLSPKLVQVLFSSWHGLYTWHPLFLFATFGLLWLGHKERRLALWLILGFALQVYVIASWRDWAQGDAFGGRMFISSLPGLALGLAALLDRIRERRARLLAAIVGMFLVASNAILLLQYRLGYVPMNAPLTLRQLTVDKLWVLADLWRRLLEGGWQ